jgi:hypothetical protein
MIMIKDIIPTIPYIFFESVIFMVSISCIFIAVDGLVGHPVARRVLELPVPSSGTEMKLLSSLIGHLPDLFNRFMRYSAIPRWKTEKAGNFAVPAPFRQEIAGLPRY